MPDPYELDAEGNPVAEADEAPEGDPAPVDGASGGTAAADVAATDPVEPGTPADAPGDPAEQEALRRQVEQTLRFMRIQTAVGFVILLVLIVVLSGIRGVMILVTIVFLLTSLAAYTFLARTLQARVLRGVPPRS